MDSKILELICDIVSRVSEEDLRHFVAQNASLSKFEQQIRNEIPSDVDQNNCSDVRRWIMSNDFKKIIQLAQNKVADGTMTTTDLDDILKFLDHFC